MIFVIKNEIFAVFDKKNGDFDEKKTEIYVKKREIPTLLKDSFKFITEKITIK